MQPTLSNAVIAVVDDNASVRLRARNQGLYQLPHIADTSVSLTLINA